MENNIKNFIEEGEKEFDKRFPSIESYSQRSGDYTEAPIPHIKAFISSRQISLIKMIVESINQYKMYYNPIGDEVNKGRGLACDDIINLIQK